MKNKGSDVTARDVTPRSATKVFEGKDPNPWAPPT